MAPGMQNFIAIGLRVSAPRICDFAVPFGVTIRQGSVLSPHLFAVLSMIILIIRCVLLGMGFILNTFWLPMV